MAEAIRVAYANRDDATNLPPGHRPLTDWFQTIPPWARTPLKQSFPAACAARNDLREAETLLLKRSDEASTAHAILQSLLTSPSATKDQVVQAESDLKDAEDARDAQGTVVDNLQDAHNQAKTTLENRREYLQNAADARNPLKQLDSFPAACNVSLGTVMMFLLANAIRNSSLLRTLTWKMMPFVDASTTRKTNWLFPFASAWNMTTCLPLFTAAYAQKVTPLTMSWKRRLQWHKHHPWKEKQNATRHCTRKQNSEKLHSTKPTEKVKKPHRNKLRKTKDTNLYDVSQRTEWVMLHMMLHVMMNMTGDKRQQTMGRNMVLESLSRVFWPFNGRRTVLIDGEVDD